MTTAAEPAGSTVAATALGPNKLWLRRALCQRGSSQKMMRQRAAAPFDLNGGQQLQIYCNNV
jgi:hypothetical protein